MISAAIQLLMQLRVLHWKTKIYNQHIILGNLYEDLDELTDELIETLMGYTEVDLETNIINIETYDKIDLNKYFKNYIAFLINIKEEYPQQSNICDSMIDKINKTCYLLKLR
jgi:hypothetical protein